MKYGVLAALLLFCTIALCQNVGIGTNSPTSKLTVTGNLSVGTSFNMPAPANGAIVQGAVGIGITNPQQKLHVDGSIISNGMMMIENCASANNTSDGFSGTTFFRVGGPSWNAADDAGRFLSWDGVSGDRLRMKVPGLSTSTPTFEFYANGVAGKLGGGSWAVFSDARLKENIQQYHSGLGLIMNLNPVTFHYKQGWGDPSRQFVGLIAQEVEKVAPQMVITMQSEKLENVRMIDPSEILFTLINAVKEQQAQIDQLRKELEQARCRH